MWDKFKFLANNFWKALLYFAILVLILALFNVYVFKPNIEQWKAYLYDTPLYVYLSYLVSEVLFGLLPPELYMKWALHKEVGLRYWQDVCLFAIVSYGAGVLSFFIGRYLQRVLLFRYMSKKVLKKLWPLFRKYGSALIIAAALTPLPWALVGILVGSTDYKLNRYLVFAIFRLLRFFIYGYFVYASISLQSFFF